MANVVDFFDEIVRNRTTEEEATAKENEARIALVAATEDMPIFSEDALALRFSERHANDLRYIATKGTWLKWDRVRWYSEDTFLAFDLARQSCRTDAQELGNGKAPNHVYSAKTVAAVERMAKADRRQATTIEEWDANDLAFNTEDD